jgi:hypothetical protein
VFSYLSTAKELVSEDIYQLGLKEYLLGNVLEYVSMDLRDWRRYEVRGREVYTVIFPLLHLLTTKLQWKRGADNLKQLTRCTCEYYDNIGVCKHIVAVCASIDREIKPLGDSVDQTLATPTLNRILDFESQSATRDWLHEFEYFFELDQQDDPQNLSLRRLYESLRAAFSHPDNEVFLEELSRYVQEHLREPRFQKRLLQLALFNRAWLVGGVGFWQVMLPAIEHSSAENKTAFWVDLWKEWEFFATGLVEVAPVVQASAQNLDHEEKLEILTRLREDKQQLPTLLSFAQFSGEYTFVLEHLSQMDIGRLIALLPELGEYHLGEQTRTFSDFLTAKDESRLVSYLRDWKHALPDSAEYIRVVELIKTQHKRRKKLIQEIRKLI